MLSSNNTLLSCLKNLKMEVGLLSRYIFEIIRTILRNSFNINIDENDMCILDSSSYRVDKKGIKYYKTSYHYVFKLYF